MQQIYEIFLEQEIWHAFLKKDIKWHFMWAEHTEEMLHYSLKCTFNLKDITSVIPSLKPSAVSFQEQQIKRTL